MSGGLAGDRTKRRFLAKLPLRDSAGISPDFAGQLTAAGLATPNDTPCGKQFLTPLVGYSFFKSPLNWTFMFWPTGEHP